MAIVKRLADYSIVGGSGGYGVEGYRGASSQDVNRALNAMLASTPGGTGRIDMANQVAASNAINKALGIQAKPGIMGVPSGRGGGIAGMNVVTPGIAAKTKEWFDSQEKKALDDEKREVGKLSAIGEIYNSMLKSASDNPLTLKAMKESPEFKEIEGRLKEQLSRVYGAQSRGGKSYVTPKGDLKKVGKPGSKMFLESGEQVIIKGYKIVDGQPKVMIESPTGRKGIADPDDLLDKEPKRKPPTQTGANFDF